MKNIIIFIIVLVLLVITYNFYLKNIQNAKTIPTQEKSKRIVKNISWLEFQEKIEQNDTVIIDIRTQSEIMNGKLFDEAREIDYYGFDFEEKVSQLDPHKTYLIYCRSGGRSGAALSVFEKYGLEAYDLIGGYNGVK